MREFDVIVVGAGPAGEVAAGRLAEAGLEVAIVERQLVGGECSFFACMPSKALLRPAEALAEAARIPGAAEAVSGAVDATAVLRLRDEVIHDLDDSDQLPWLQERSVVLIRGEARVVAERRVAVGDEELAARRAVVVATGSAPRMPAIQGLAEAGPWTNREITTARTVPGRLLMIGGGAVNVEMAQAWASLGSQVTLLVRGDRVLPREEPFAAEQVGDALRRAGVDLRTRAQAVAVQRDGAVTAELDSGERVTADEIVVSTGRRPRSECVEPLGYAPGAPVPVDDHLRSERHPWLYAVGDVNGRAQLTHAGKYQARIAADHVLGRDARVAPQASGRLSPRVVFTDPQVTAVGHTLASAEEAGVRCRAVDVATSGNAGGSFYGRNAPGTARMVVDEDRRVMVGATITGPETADFLHAATIAVSAEVPLERLWHAVPAFPTRSELWLRWLEAYGL